MDKKPFFRRVDWLALLFTFVIALIGYALTLQPTVGLEDSGELVVASDYLGVPHPPGYPIWTLLTWVFQWVLHPVTYHGHPNPAWAVNFFSAFAGASACGVLAMLVSRSGMDLLRSMKTESQMLGEKTESLFCCVAGISAGLLLAFGQGMWSQSVITEVYSFNIFFQSLVLLFLYRWIVDTKQPVWMILCAFTFGLGTTNHQTLMFMGLAIGIAILFRDYKLFRDFVIAGIPLLIMVAAVKILGKESDWSWLSGWDHPGFYLWTGYALLVPVIAIFALPNGKTVGFTILAAEVGLAFYLYMPFAGEQNPPINWGYPRTWQGFMHAITRGQYERVVLSDIFGDPSRFVLQCKAFFYDLSSQFYLPLVLVGFLPFTAWKMRISKMQVNGFLIAIGLLIPAAGLEVVQKLVEIYYPAVNASVFSAVSQPLTFVLFLMFGLGFGLAVVNVIDNAVKRVREVFSQGSVWDWMEGALLSGMMAVAAGAMMLMSFKLVGALVVTAAQNPLWVNATLFLWIVLPFVFLGGAAVLKYKAPQLTFDVDESGQHWFITTIVAFISVGLVFIILQNPKLDIQTLFIGRVQYIQSHAIYALWLGYGLLFAVAYIESFFKNNSLIRYIMVVSLLALPVVLVGKNYLDPTQERIVGGSEQDGHDFGWQFGNWQLRGVEGIKEDLWYYCGQDREKFDAEWANYPNPDYPQPMETNAVFFGGTDPGRFVPTYMIYCPQVRPDIYLITQNALADNTYMAVMRDLYGDQIWIPSQFDSNNAFKEYIQGVKSGRVQAGADVSTEGGRVQVQGVGGVMQINGILCKQIFDHNQLVTESKTDELTRQSGAAVVPMEPVSAGGKLRTRSFYVEESYVIPWMYPYLTPHGLIMKINNQPTLISKEMIKNDHDFWDWYVDRLVHDRKFQRDVVAKKTFSKLRTALAGLYAARGHRAEAEYAFKQAVQLYPLSPEAVFRLANLYMQERRFDEATQVLEAFIAVDVHNDKARQFAAQIEQVKKLVIRKAELEGEIKGAAHAELNDAVELLQICRSLNDEVSLRQVHGNLLRANLPAQACRQLVQVVASMKRPDLLEPLMIKYLQLEPGDVKCWIDLAAVRVASGRQVQALDALQQAVSKGGEPIRKIIRKDGRFVPLQRDSRFQKLIPPAALDRTPFAMPF